MTYVALLSSGGDFFLWKWFPNLSPKGTLLPVPRCTLFPALSLEPYFPPTQHRQGGACCSPRKKHLLQTGSQRAPSILSRVQLTCTLCREARWGLRAPLVMHAPHRKKGLAAE